MTILVQQLRERASRATPGPWELQTSNSWRRIGNSGGRFADGDVLAPTIHRSDNHPDLAARQEDLDFIVAADPTTVLALLDEIDRLQAALEDERQLRAKVGRIAHYLNEFANKRTTFSRIQEVNDAIQEVPDGN